MRRNLFIILVVAVVLSIFLGVFQGLKSFGPVLAGNNLLNNSDFETGDTSGWSDANFTLEMDPDKVHSGSYSAGIHAGRTYPYQRFAVNKGSTYVLTGWVKWITCSGDWGQLKAEILDPGTWQLVDNTGLINERYQQGVWNKFAVSFVAPHTELIVNFGIRGPKDSVEAYFDDLAFFERGENIPPTINPTANITSGSVPLNVQFYANDEDVDGAVIVYAWDFGEGGYSTFRDPTHTFLSRGDHVVTLSAYDDAGAVTSQSLTIQVEDSEAPLVTITSPSSGTIHPTYDSSTTLGGTASDNGQVMRVVWDNINTRQEGIVTITSGSSINWTTSTIDLKPGTNEILITATDDDGRIATDALKVYRYIDAPIISNIQVNSSSVNVYEKFEVQFDLETVADYWFFPYDVDPPPGVKAKKGVTAEGVFTSPSGQEIRHPAFFYTKVDQSGDWLSSHYKETAEDHWMIRLSPQEEGQWHFDIEVTDDSGTSRVNGGDFTANPPVKKGFIGVSAQDSRYFEFSNGDLFWPIGPTSKDYLQNQTYGMNHTRPWMIGLGAYTTNQARWQSCAEQLGNEGYMSRLNFENHYPSHELTHEIFYPNGKNIRMGFMDDQFRARLIPGERYLVKVRLKTENIEGPEDPNYPYGFMIKYSGWAPNSDWNNLGQSLRNQESFIPAVSTDRDWHTVVSEYTVPGNYQHWVTSFVNLFLDNVTRGEVYIDEFSMKQILPDGNLGGELVRQYRADLHTYVEQRPAAWFDNQVEQGELYDVFHKYVVQDKNDWIPNHLLSEGVFAHKGDGYYQLEGTKMHWQLEAWWRYLIARWGYSTAVHSWEFNNEGTPDGTYHYRAAQSFAKFMHDNDYHPHLALTSFWCCWRPDFWGNVSGEYPDIDYADVHYYIDTANAESYDLAQWVYDRSTEYYNSQVGKPVQMGEAGLSGALHDHFSEQTDPTWWHNFIWAHINHGGMSCSQYWFEYHLDQINYQSVIKAYTDFMEGIPLNSGFYEDAQAVVNNTNLRAWGQKDTLNSGLHLWVQNKNHTWKNLYDGVDITPQSGIVTVFGFGANESLTVEWWDTWAGNVSKTENLTTNAQGTLVLQIVGLVDDLAVRILPSEVEIFEGDVDHDGDVDKDDGFLVLRNYYERPLEVGGYFDPVGDDRINTIDFGYVVKDWGK